MHGLYQKNAELCLIVIINNFKHLMGFKFLEIGACDFNRVSCQNYDAWRDW
jgi:hypothetical protein